MGLDALADARVFGAPSGLSSNTVFVSAATASGIHVKKRSGKLPRGPTITEATGAYEFELLPISVSDAVRAASLDRDHNDPCDRMLVAQSLEPGMVMATDDLSLIAAPGIRTL